MEQQLRLQGELRGADANISSVRSRIRDKSRVVPRSLTLLIAILCALQCATIILLGLLYQDRDRVRPPMNAPHVPRLRTEIQPVTEAAVKKIDAVQIGTPTITEEASSAYAVAGTACNTGDALHFIELRFRTYDVDGYYRGTVVQDFINVGKHDLFQYHIPVNELVRDAKIDGPYASQLFLHLPVRQAREF